MRCEHSLFQRETSKLSSSQQRTLKAARINVMGKPVRARSIQARAHAVDAKRV
jgi:hypothetical protein